MAALQDIPVDFARASGRNMARSKFHPMALFRAKTSSRRVSVCPPRKVLVFHNTIMQEPSTFNLEKTNSLQQFLPERADKSRLTATNNNNNDVPSDTSCMCSGRRRQPTIRCTLTTFELSEKSSLKKKTKRKDTSPQKARPACRSPPALPRALGSDTASRTSV